MLWWQKEEDRTPEEYLVLAEKYYFGKGVAEDKKKAFEYYEKAASKGNALAIYNLGIFYDLGEVVDEDHPKAYSLWQAAIANGKTDAEEDIRLSEQQDTLNRIPMYHESALGHISIGFGKDAAEDAKQHFEEALKSYRKLYNPSEEDRKACRSIYRGLACSTYLLGRCYETQEKEMVLAARHYYLKGMPISEEQSETVIYSIKLIFSRLYELTNDRKYGQELFDTIKNIYESCLDNFKDADYRASIIADYAMQLGKGEFCRRDIWLAKKVNNELLALAQAAKREQLEGKCDYADDYADMSMSIAAWLNGLR